MTSMGSKRHGSPESIPDTSLKFNKSGNVTIKASGGYLEDELSANFRIY